MAKVRTKAIFKSYNQQQALLLPPTLDELIPSTHLVRVVNQVVEEMDITPLIEQYQGGGTSSYHPRMLLKVLLYGYCVKIYTGRKVARALSQDINFMWLSGMNRPDFRTINGFRSSRAKEVIEDLFKELLLFLMREQYIRLENYFCDGSTFVADGNKHKMVWKKNAQRYKEIAEKKCQQLFKDIDKLNQQEDKQYGELDLEEKGEQSTITSDAINKQVKSLNQTISTAAGKQQKQKAESLKKKLEEESARIKKYERQVKTAGNRSGYNKTDEDATAMMMKNKVETLPAYNVLGGCEGQFITGVSVHQNTNDATCFGRHLEQIREQQPKQVEKIIADSIFGTEQNYELIDEQGIDNLMKFPQYHSEQKKKNRENSFTKDNFAYDNHTDTYTCPNNQPLTLQRTFKQTNKKTGYESTIKQYQCSDCSQCAFYGQCCKSEQGNNRTISVNEKLDRYKQQARENLKTEEGEKLRKSRGVEIESCFGDIKHNMGFRRFHLRGLKKVKTEITIVAMAHNLRKVHLKQIEKIKNAA
jgi:transposase